MYRNVHVHDSGVLATQQKEKLQNLIQDQIEIGCKGFAEEDHWIMEINLKDLETASGKTQDYWLLAIIAAREA